MGVDVSSFPGQPGHMSTATDIVSDSERRGFIGALPPRLRPYASLMRLDRPIGTWLLSWPCAWVLIALLCAVGLLVLSRLNVAAAVISLVSIAPVAAYPFMKRLTWWPQAWLGLVFSWGALVGWPAVTGGLAWAPILLWFGSIAWVVGYDTLYAIQDMEDDALVGVKSSARRLGDKAALGVGICSAIALLLWGAAIWRLRPDMIALAALLPMALHLLWQVATLRPDDGADALAKFRSNRFAGLLMFLACLVVGTT